MSQQSPSCTSARRGFTLLEVILALGLTIIVVAAVGGAMRFQMFTLEASRVRLEEAQLARAILRRLADDIRGTVQEAPIDFSAVTKLAESSLAGADPSQLEALSGSDAASGVDTEALTESAADADLMTDDITSSTTPSAKPGLYGNAEALQLDVSRLPRLDEYQRVTYLDATGESRTQFPSDIKTVTYYLRPHDSFDGSTPQEASENLASQLALDPSRMQTAGGLVRREVDRAVALWKSENMPTDSQRLFEELLATEVVALQFRYFDGLEWVAQWDSTTQEALPLAIELALVIDAQGIGETITVDLFASDSSDTIYGTLDPTRPLSVYRQVVNLPLAKIPAEEEATDEETIDDAAMAEEEPLEAKGSAR